MSLALTLIGGASVLQDLPVPAPRPAAPAEEDPHEEMARLFGRIEVVLGQIDRLLWSARDLPAESEAAALSSKLKDALARSRETQAAIDRILELAQHPHPEGKGGT